MTVTPASFDAATTAFTVAFGKGLQSAAPIWRQISDLRPSSTKTERYPFRGKLARMREWIGPRTLKQLQAYDYTVVNRKFEDTVEVPLDDIEDDRIGLWTGAMQDLGEACSYLPDDLVIEALIEGDAQICYDGEYFFDTDHPTDPYNSGAGTQANLYTSTSLTEANYATVRANMMKRTDEHGNIIRVNPNLLVVPAALEATARKIVIGEYISQSSGSTQTNVMAGTAGILVLPQLDSDSTTTWYLLDTSRPVKPFFYQQRVAPQFQNDTALDSPRVMDTDCVLYGARARGAAGYALWQLASRCNA